MPSVFETGFVSKEQEEFLRMNEPSLYKAVIKKHGHYKPKRNNPPPPKNKVKKGK